MVAALIIFRVAGLLLYFLRPALVWGFFGTITALIYIMVDVVRAGLRNGRGESFASHQKAFTASRNTPVTTTIATIASNRKMSPSQSGKRRITATPIHKPIPIRIADTTITARSFVSHQGGSVIPGLHTRLLGEKQHEQV